MHTNKQFHKESGIRLMFKEVMVCILILVSSPSPCQLTVTNLNNFCISLAGCKIYTVRKFSLLFFGAALVKGQIHYQGYETITGSSNIHMKVQIYLSFQGKKEFLSPRFCFVYTLQKNSIWPVVYTINVKPTRNSIYVRIYVY